MRRCVWSRNLKNEEAMTRVGSKRHRKRKLNFDNIDARYDWEMKTVKIVCEL